MKAEPIPADPELDILLRAVACGRTGRPVLSAHAFEKAFFLNKVCNCIRVQTDRNNSAFSSVLLDLGETEAHWGPPLMQLVRWATEEA